MINKFKHKAFILLALMVFVLVITSYTGCLKRGQQPAATPTPAITTQEQTPEVIPTQEAQVQPLVASQVQKEEKSVKSNIPQYSINIGKSDPFIKPNSGNVPSGNVPNVPQSGNTTNQTGPTGPGSNQPGTPEASMGGPISVQAIFTHYGHGGAIVTINGVNKIVRPGQVVDGYRIISVYAKTLVVADERGQEYELKLPEILQQGGREEQPVNNLSLPEVPTGTIVNPEQQKNTEIKPPESTTTGPTTNITPATMPAEEKPPAPPESTMPVNQNK